MPDPSTEGAIGARTTPTGEALLTTATAPVVWLGLGIMLSVGLGVEEGIELGIKEGFGVIAGGFVGLGVTIGRDVGLGVTMGFGLGVTLGLGVAVGRGVGPLPVTLTWMSAVATVESSCSVNRAV